MPESLQLILDESLQLIVDESLQLILNKSLQPKRETVRCRYENIKSSFVHGHYKVKSTSKQIVMNKKEKKLLAIFSDLDKNDGHSLISYAEFLLQKAKQDGRLAVVKEPLLIPRPEEEKVVAAIKRLSAAYPMLKKDVLFNQTAALMSEHIMQGREAVEVINELEVLFKQHYTDFCADRESDE